MKIAFFCIKGLESFIKPIADHLATHEDFDIKCHWIQNLENINEKINEADIVWFEWANEIPVNLTMQLAMVLSEKKVIVRLHSYEALVQFHQQINWSVVDTVIFVSSHIKKYCNIDHGHQIVISNGIDLDRFKFIPSKAHGNRIAMIGHLSSKKGVMLLVHAFSHLPEHMELHIVGDWQDERERIYFSHIIKAMKINDRIFYHGRIGHEDMPKWMENKNYLICTSPWESQNLSICEAMATGTKPLIHNFWGAETIYGPDFIWTSIDDLKKQIDPSSQYDPSRYRQYIKTNFNQKDKLKKIIDLIQYIGAG